MDSAGRPKTVATILKDHKDYLEVAVSNGVVLIDPEDLDIVQSCTWNAVSGWVYNRNHNLFLHRLVYERVHGQIPEGMLVDHRNMNPLDNRRSNLRLADKAKNNPGRQAVLTPRKLGAIFCLLL